MRELILDLPEQISPSTKLVPQLVRLATFKYKAKRGAQIFLANCVSTVKVFFHDCLFLFRKSGRTQSHDPFIAAVASSFRLRVVDFRHAMDVLMTKDCVSSSGICAGMYVRIKEFRSNKPVGQEGL